MSKKVFPINTVTSCPLKWNWSTVFLNAGMTSSCHRTSHTELTEDNFHEFHNTSVKQADREAMLRGEWPESNCSYCRQIEEAGGVSDRMTHMQISDFSPRELTENPTATVVTPTILEIYFNNACNMKCLYCNSSLSSKISEENRKFGVFEHGEISLHPYSDKKWKPLVPKLFAWLEENIQSLKRIHVLGGETFLQDEFDNLIDLIDKTPAPSCVLNIVTNLNVPNSRVQYFINKIRNLVAKKKLARFDVTASIDCWGPEQEYVRHGLNLELFKTNFEYLLSERWITLNINQTLSSLTIKTVPMLLDMLREWRRERRVGHYFSEVEPGPTYMTMKIFGPGVFDQDFETVLSLMKQDETDGGIAYRYMQGIYQNVKSSERNTKAIEELFVYLNEMDRRRGTIWETVFPWLKEFNNVV